MDATTNDTLPLEWGAAFNSTPVNDSALLGDYYDIEEVSMGVKIGSTVLLVVLITGGTFGNCLIISAVYTTPSLRTVSNIFIVNLAVADLMVSSIVDTFNIVGILDQRFLQDHPVVCEVVGVICMTSCICSLYSVSNISINRLLFVVKPHWHSSVYTKPKTLMIVAVSWFYSFLFDLPLLLGWGRHSYDIKTMGCTYDRTHTFSYTLFLVIAGISLPLAVVVCSYSKIFYHVHQSKVRVAVHLANPKGNMNNNVNYEEIRLIKTLVAVCVMFYICWLPYAVVVLADFDDHWPRAVHFMATIMAHGSSSVNCLVYGFMNKKFKTAFRKLLGMKTQPNNAESKKKDTLPLPPIQEVPGPPSFCLQQSTNTSSRL
ncbi:melatonin receptor type 1B-A-like [Branchiostoma floridae]|uniref:Melatonin receptor type 1B-A-like n=1 Tax=Branchiostoma floridae TaxID=7739 RepID=A0A9J7KFJ9_BRAFL|nr:melatonin receptor type 1B-A-like [Branchiostoma floridae]